MTKLGEWRVDLALGVRLAVGSGRTSRAALARMAFAAVGIGLAVAVLLVAASVGSLERGEAERRSAQTARTDPIPGVAPVHVVESATRYRGDRIPGLWAYAERGTTVLLPGLARTLRPGEFAVSPALADLLASAEGAGLRPRFAGLTRVAVIGRDGVTAPADLRFYVGTDRSLRAAAGDPERGAVPSAVYAYGGPVQESPLPPALVALVVIGTVGMLVPIVVFVLTSARMAGAERERRLSAIRLVGAGAGQVRRIAASEAVLPALVGVGLGGLLFSALRPALGEVRLFGLSFYAEDFVPAAEAVALIAVGVPLVAVLASLFALRRTLVDPLGVVRSGSPRPRALWWRLVVLTIAVAVLVLADVGAGRDALWLNAVIAGSCLLLVAVALLLPWVVEFLIARTRGGAPSWQLAVRRLQLDAGTSARVVSGLVVVMTGAIALQLATVGQARSLEEQAVLPDPAAEGSLVLNLGGDEGDAARVIAAVRGASGVAAVEPIRRIGGALRTGGQLEGVVASCRALRPILAGARCVDGSVFLQDPVPPGTQVRIPAADGGTVRWVIPRGVAPLPSADYQGLFWGTALIAPGAVRGILSKVASFQTLLAVETSPGTSHAEVLDAVRTRFGLAAVPPGIEDMRGEWSAPRSVEQFLAVRATLSAASVLVLLVASLSVLMLAVEQVHQRRRALAALSAAGISAGTLGRSLLWQNAIPLLAGTLLAAGAGVLLAWLVLPLPPAEDVGAVLGLTGLAAAAVVALVTAASLPVLRAATSVRNLRIE